MDEIEIKDIISIDSEYILTLSEKCVKITNIKEKYSKSIVSEKQNLKFRIDAFEYEKSKDMIIYSGDSYINFINRLNFNIEIVC